jgi:hydrogenase expression/formation protein HypE
MHAHPLGAAAAVIGTLTERHPGMLVATTRLGGTRAIPMRISEQLPKIC